MMKAFPEVTNGRSILHIVNDSNEAVTILGILLGKGGAVADALEGTGRLELSPKADTRLDITSTVQRVFGGNVAGLQSRRFSILLVLRPDPPNQVQPAEYEVSIKDGQIIHFS